MDRSCGSVVKNVILPVIFISIVLLGLGTLVVFLLDKYVFLPDTVNEGVAIVQASSPIVIQDEVIPLGIEDDNCFIHWIMTGLTVIYAGYNAVRVHLRSLEGDTPTVSNNVQRDVRVTHQF